MWSDCFKNHNKFYIVQLLQPKGIKDGSSCRVWIRYGRVGGPGAMSSQMLSKEEAIAFYNKQIKAKVRKGYTEIKLALGKNDGEDGQAGGSLTRSKPQFSIKESKTQSCNLE